VVVEENATLDESVISEVDNDICPVVVEEKEKISDEYGQKKQPLSRPSIIDPNVTPSYCMSFLQDNCPYFKKPLSNLTDCHKCEICLIEYICTFCFLEQNVHKCFICVLDNENNIAIDGNNESDEKNIIVIDDNNESNENNIIVIDDNNESNHEDAYITDSEQKRKTNIEKRLNKKLRFSSLIPIVANNNDNNTTPQVSSKHHRNNHFKLIDFSKDESDDDIEDPDRDRVMLQIGKAGQGNGIIQGYQSDIDCLRSDPNIKDIEKCMTSTTMDILTTFIIDKFPLTNGKDVIYPLPSWFWQLINGLDPTYSAFLGGKTLKELREFFYYKIIQFNVFDRGHITTVTISNLHAIMFSDFSNRPIREVTSSLVYVINYLYILKETRDSL
jgi:hypothetical protein